MSAVNLRFAPCAPPPAQPATAAGTIEEVRIIGITPGTTRGHLARATLEGIVYSVRDFIDTYREIHPEDSDTVGTAHGFDGRASARVAHLVTSQRSCTLRSFGCAPGCSPSSVSRWSSRTDVYPPLSTPSARFDLPVT